MINVRAVLCLLISQTLAVALLKSLNFLRVSLLHRCHSAVVLGFKTVEVCAIAGLEVRHFSVMSVITLKKIRLILRAHSSSILVESPFHISQIILELSFTAIGIFLTLLQQLLVELCQLGNLLLVITHQLLMLGFVGRLRMVK